MASRFLGKSWLRLRPLVKHKVIPEPIWLNVAETFPPLAPPDPEAKKHKRNIRRLFPEEVERMEIDTKYRMEQTHALRETETDGVYGREEMRKELALFRANEMNEETAWEMAVKTLRTRYKISAKNIEKDLELVRLLKVKQLIE